MKKIFSGTSRTGLLEIVISTVFFIIVGMFTLGVFTKTEKMRQEAMELSESVIQAQMSMEKVIGLHFDTVFSDSVKTEVNGVTMYSKYYDVDWNQTATPDYYLITVTVENNDKANGILTDYTVTVYKMRIMESANEIYSIKTSKFWYGE